MENPDCKFEIMSGPGAALKLASRGNLKKLNETSRTKPGRGHNRSRILKFLIDEFL